MPQSMNRSQIGSKGRYGGHVRVIWATATKDRVTLGVEIKFSENDTVKQLQAQAEVSGVK